MSNICNEEGIMTMTPVARVVGILAVFAFVGEVGLAVAAEETKKEKASAATAQPGGGIQSNKAKASESPRLTKGKSCSGATPKIKKVTPDEGDRKSTRLNSSHGYISYAVFCLKKKKKEQKNCGYTDDEYNAMSTCI